MRKDRFLMSFDTIVAECGGTGDRSAAVPEPADSVRSPAGGGRQRGQGVQPVPPLPLARGVVEPSGREDPAWPAAEGVRAGGRAAGDRRRRLRRAAARCQDPRQGDLARCGALEPRLLRQSRGLAVAVALLAVEQLFRQAKSALRTRPIFHSSDAAIRGHVFCSFLALVLRKELDARCRAAGLQPGGGDVRRDLERLQRATIEQDGKTWELRTEATGTAAGIFKALRIALPPRVRPLGQSPPAQTPDTLPKRRGQPRRRATRP